MEADPKTEDKKLSKDTTHMAASKQGGEVLLMTRRVRVITLDGTVTQARALLDSMASTLLISQRLTKKIATTVSP